MLFKCYFTSTLLLVQLLTLHFSLNVLLILKGSVACSRLQPVVRYYLNF